MWKFLLLFILVAPSVYANYRVLLIHSYSRDSRPVWVNEIYAGIMTELIGIAQVHEFELKTKQLPSTEFDNLANQALLVYEKLKPDLVLLSDDNALRLMLPRIGKQVPVVYLGINGGINQDYPWLRYYKNSTGILEHPLIRRTLLEMQKSLNLPLKKVLILLGKSTTANAFFNVDLGGVDEFTFGDNIQARVKRLGQFSHWQQVVNMSQADGFDAILVAGYYAMNQGTEHIPAQNISRWLAQHSPLPVFTVHKNQVRKNGVMAGMGLSGRSMAEDAGVLARQILLGDVSPAETLPRPHISNLFFFSQSELNKRGLSLSPKYLNRSMMQK